MDWSRSEYLWSYLLAVLLAGLNLIPGCCADETPVARGSGISSPPSRDSDLVRPSVAALAAGAKFKAWEVLAVAGSSKAGKKFRTGVSFSGDILRRRLGRGGGIVTASRSRARITGFASTKGSPLSSERDPSQSRAAAARAFVERVMFFSVEFEDP